MSKLPVEDVLNQYLALDAVQLETLFLTHSQSSMAAYQTTIAAAYQALAAGLREPVRAYSGLDPAQIAAALADVDLCPEVGRDLAQVLTQVGDAIVRNSVNVSHPTCIAHLHCPPLTAALAAEMVISATNQSMDSWDQSPAATLVEQQVMNWLCQLFGYNALADGTFTSGGTQSNFMGLLLARDAYAQQHLHWSIQQQGLPVAAHRFRILCSDVSHFTIRQSAALLGLGQQAVVAVETDANYQMRASKVKSKLEELQQQDLLPIALVATAGTTDFGSIDPIAELADCAQAHGLWLHVDAAFGGALVLSDRHRHTLTGIETADSIAVDFHKLFYQPISCGAFLLKKHSHFELLKLHADYLNPETNEDLGIPDLVTKSIQTTRRFDALKLFVCLQVVGRRTFAAMIDYTIELAKNVAQQIEMNTLLELAAHPMINAVVFRYCPTNSPAHIDEIAWANRINSQIRLSLIHSGEAVIAQTKIGQRTYLKFTLLNPRTQLTDIKDLLTRIRQLGQMLETQLLNTSDERL
jgi:L-2,4-diaminobutyrate decarboxylase